MREALGHDGDVLSNRAQLAGLVAQGRAAEAQSLGLALPLFFSNAGISAVTKLAAQERAAAPPHPSLGPHSRSRTNTAGQYFPDQPTRDQPARAAKGVHK